MGLGDRNIARAAMALRAVEQFASSSLDKKKTLDSPTRCSRAARSTNAGLPREVVKRALGTLRDAIILVHNHPSGDPTPCAPTSR